MNSKTVALIAVFAALAVVLTITSPIRIPAPYTPFPFLYYQIWEIPLVAAFLLFGPRIGTSIAIVNTAVLLVVFQGSLPTGPLYNLVAVLSMLLGIYIAVKLASRFKGNSDVLTITSSTALGIILRVVVMTVINWSFLRFPPPLGYEMDEALLMALLPLIGLFNATVALYTVPLGHFVTKAVSVGVKTTHWGQTKKKA